jgi:tripartite-type tricarboxylate transporter receptor subunit TctC
MMIRIISRTVFSIAGMAAAALAAMPAMPQTFLPGPVQLVIAYPPGGTGDIIARALVDGLAKALGQTVTLDHRPGASGAAGTKSVAQAPPNGQTLLVGQAGEIAISPSFIRKLGYAPQTDLQPVSLLGVVPLALAVQSTAPYAKVGDLLKASRSAPRALTFASAGRATPGYFAGELLRLRSRGRFVHMPFDGGGPALDALLAGRVDLYFPALPTAVEQTKAGRLKILALSSTRRSLAVPNVPTLMESGVGDFDLNLWAGIFAPAATPKELVTRLNSEINQVIALPGVRDYLISMGADLTLLSPDQFRSFVSADTDRYAKLIDDEFCATCPW